MNMNNPGIDGLHTSNDEVSRVQSALAAVADPKTAAQSQRYFKTGPGEYAEGDLFRGIRVPRLREFAREFRNLALMDCLTLLTSAFHEDRLLVLLILGARFRKASEAQRESIYQSYMQSRAYINNWDLVDCSAEPIVGGYLFDKPRDMLVQLAVSPSLWDRRIAMLASFYFIKQGQFDDSLNLAKLLLHDPEDLIHKAVGWMLREIGKRDQAVLERFLRSRYERMPRTMLRYAIERFADERRQDYLQGRI